MKTSQFARGFVGALSLMGVMASVGCSSEPLSPEEAAEIGSTAEAITRIGTVANITAGRQFASSCVITDDRSDGRGARPFMLVAGGYNASGAALGDAYLYDRVTDTWLTVASLPSGQERGEAKLVQVSSTSCLLMGGASHKTTSPTLRTQAYLFTSNGSTGGWATAGSITGRVKFQASKCGTGSKVIAVGGDVPGGSPLTSIQVYNAETGATAWGSLTNLNSARHSFAMATEDNQKFFIHSGHNGSGAVASVELLNVTSACALNEINQKNISGPGGIGGKSLVGAVAITTGTTDKFVVTAGDDLTNLNRDADDYAVTSWVNPIGVTRTAHANALAANDVSRYPTLVKVSASRWAMFGGEDRSAGFLLATPQTIAYDFSAGSYVSRDPLATARLGSVAEQIPSDSIYVASGLNTTTTLTATTEKFTSP